MASRVLKQFSYKIIYSSIDPVQLVRSLNSKEIVPDELYFEVTDTNSGKQAADRLARIVDFFSACLQTDESLFHPFLVSIEEIGGCFCKKLVQDMKTAYEGQSSVSE